MGSTESLTMTNESKTKPFSTNSGTQSGLESPPFIVVSGASGSGKTTICRKMAAKYGFYYSVSHTTRLKRPIENHGIDYYFVSEDEFQAMIARDEFFEWARVYDNFYGTSKKIISEKLADGQGVILDLDTQGAAQIKNQFPKALLVFIDTPSIEDLQQRLSSRATDSKQEIAKRVARAENEISKKGQYDYVVMNDNLDDAISQVETIIENHL